MTQEPSNREECIDCDEPAMHGPRLSPCARTVLRRIARVKWMRIDGEGLQRLAGGVAALDAAVDELVKAGLLEWEDPAAPWLIRATACGRQVAAKFT